LSRRLAANSLLLALALVLAVLPAKTARRPGYGGTLRIEIGAVIHSLDLSVAAVSPEEAAAKLEIDSLINDRSGAPAAQPAAGPFRISAWEPGKRLTLAANGDFPKGRPFVDAIDFTMGKSAKDRLLDLELDKTDFIRIPADQARSAAESGVRVNTSQPDELLAILFATGGSNAPSSPVRQAIAQALDRGAIVNFVLQKTGEPAGGLLPQWSSGTAFLFSASSAPAGAVQQVKEIRAQNQPSIRLLLGYDSGDSVEQRVAERIVVDAREAGIAMTAGPIQGTSALGAATVPPGFDARIIRWRMPSPRPDAALANFLAAFPGLAQAAADACGPANSAERIYRCERAIVDTREIIPLAFLPQVYGLSARMRDWQAPGPGETWPLADVWLDGAPQ